MNLILCLWKILLEEETDDVEVENMRKDEREQLTGQLDFDYDDPDVNILQPTGQLRNQMRNFANSVGSILDEDFKTHGCRRWNLT